MSLVIDTVFLRRPKLEYISPPICEVIFSSTGTALLVLEPLHKNSAPTGVRFDGSSGRIKFSWNVYPGAVCYNVYKLNVTNQLLNGPCFVTPTSTYTTIHDCLPANSVTITTPGCYRVSAVTADGESELSPATCTCDCGCATCNCGGGGGGGDGCPEGSTFNEAFQQCEFPYFDCPEGFVWDSFLGACVSFVDIDCPEQDCPEGFFWHPVYCNCFPICPEQACPPGFIWDFWRCGCVVDLDCPSQPCPVGFTWDSVECRCFPIIGDGCPAQSCPPSQTWDFSQCRCLRCPEENCPIGFTWNPATCQCEGSSCPSFIDQLDGIPNLSDMGEGGFAAGFDGAGNLLFYKNRVISPPILMPGPFPFADAVVACANNQIVGHYPYPPDFFNAGFIYNTDTAGFSTLGDGSGNNYTAIDVAENGHVLFEFQDIGTGDQNGLIWPALTVVKHTGSSVDFPVNVRKMNESNVVTGEFADNVIPSNGSRAFRWSLGVMTDIHPAGLTGDANDASSAINSAGHIAGTSIDADSGNRVAFINVGGASSLITTIDHNVEADVFINGSDMIALTMDNLPQIWNGGLTAIPLLPTKTEGIVNGINDGGAVIGSMQGDAFFYKDGVTQKLIDLLPFGHGWDSISDATFISNDYYIAGTGTRGAYTGPFVCKICVS